MTRRVGGWGLGGDRGSLKQNGTGCPRTGRLAGLMQHISISQDVATLEWRSARAPPSYFFFFQICSDLGGPCRTGLQSAAQQQRAHEERWLLSDQRGCPTKAAALPLPLSPLAVLK